MWVISLYCSTTSSCDVWSETNITAFPLFHFNVKNKHRILLWWAISQWFPLWCEASSDRRVCWWTGVGSQRRELELLSPLLWCLGWPPSEAPGTIVRKQYKETARDEEGNLREHPLLATLTWLDINNFCWQISLRMIFEHRYAKFQIPNPNW